MTVSSHVLDAVRGAPAKGVAITLSQRNASGWTSVDTARTDDDGRVRFTATTPVGVYCLEFDIEGYLGADTFYPEVTITFRIQDADTHHHVPLLLSPFAYSTYRGS